MRALDRRWSALALVATLLAGCTPATDDATDGAPVAARTPAQQAQRPPPAPKAAAPDKPKPRARQQNRPGTQPKPRARAAPSQPAPPAAPGTPALRGARTPQELAQVLLAAETALRDPSVRGAALASAGHTQQRVYRRLVARPRLAAQVVAAVPQALRPIARRNIDAGVSLASLSSPQTKLPDWRIIEPAPASELLRHYRRAAARFGLRWEYLAAINLVETRMGRIRGRSTAGAQGPMQFMPQTWAAYGRGDINEESDAIEAAARYLADHGAPGDMHRALWNYNHSDRYVEAVSAYAEVMQADPRAYRGYYHWQVYYRMRQGAVLLPVGYGS